MGRPSSMPKRFFLLISLLLGVLFLSTVLKADQIHDGDVAPRGNPDGVVDIADVLIQHRIAAGLITPTPDELTHGDIAPICNPDGVIDISDTLVGMRVATGQLTLDATPPAITITSHTSGEILFDPNVTISGTIDDNTASVYVNGVPATVGGGTYSADIILGAGPNTVTIDAIDPCQNMSQLQITLNYSTGPTNVSGNISTDTTWTAAGTPYLVGGNITVDNGVTLTIEQGAEIRFEGNYEVIVDGTLLVQGSLGNEIVFTSDNAVPAKGDWRGITINSTGTGSLIDYAVIEYAYRGFSVNGADVTISNSTITNFSNAGIYMTNVASGTISGNTIGNLPQVGYYGIYLYSSSPTISGNTIQNNGTGIYIYLQSAPWVNGGNVITGNSTGLRVQGNNQINNNPNPVVTGNEIYGNSVQNYQTLLFYDAVNTVLDATNNWWGTTDAGDIASLIYDASENANYSPVVDFTPYLDGPGGNPVSGNFLNGTIQNNTILTSGTIYDMVGDLNVDSGATLIIEAGVTLRIAGNYELLVNGTMQVQGSVDNEVLFTSDASPQAAGDWQGITFTSSSVGSLIDYAVIEYAYHGISVDSTDVTISNSTITNFDYAGIYMTNSAGGTINGNMIANMTQQNYGIFLSNSSPNISGNVILKNKSGIFIVLNSSPLINGSNIIIDNIYGFEIYGGNPVITGNEIYDNTSYDYYADWMSDASDIVLDATNNWWGTTDEETLNGNILEFADMPDTSPIVSFVPFLDAPQGVPINNSSEGFKYLQGACTANTTLTTAESPYLVIGQYVIEPGVTFTIQPGVTLFFLDSTSGLYSFGNLQITGTEVDPVILTSYSLSPIQGDWQGVTFDFDSTLYNGLVEHAAISYAASGIRVYNSSNPTIQNSTISHCYQGIFSDKDSGMDDPQPTLNDCELYNNTSYNYYNYSAVNSPLTVNATNNWWGNNDISTIEYLIRDYNDNNALALVDIDPYVLKFSPNGDGTDDAVTICYDFGTVQNWTLTIKDELNNVVKTYQGTGSNICQDWDGTDTGGSPIGTGSYTYFFDVSGTLYSSGPITLDISAPMNATVSITDPQYINYIDITLSLSSQEAEDMIISEQPDFSGAAWQPYVRASTLTLSSAEGTKTVYTKFRDQSSNPTAVVTDTVVLDVTPPVLSLTYPDDGEMIQ